MILNIISIFKTDFLLLSRLAAHAFPALISEAQCVPKLKWSFPLKTKPNVSLPIAAPFLTPPLLSLQNYILHPSSSHTLIQCQGQEKHQN